jgi:hypothetical protein
VSAGSLSKNRGQPPGNEYQIADFSTSLIAAGPASLKKGMAAKSMGVIGNYRHKTKSNYVSWRLSLQN